MYTTTDARLTSPRLSHFRQAQDIREFDHLYRQAMREVPRLHVASLRDRPVHGSNITRVGIRAFST